jgi:chemotaxis response regulator CheB
MNADRSGLAPEARAPRPRDATRTSTRVVLATSDPVFAVLCRRALEGANQQLLAAVSPPELLETVRQLAPDFLVLDADGEDVAALKVLATKVMLVSDARVVLVSAYLAPGSPGLCALLQSIVATFVQKPQGSSSLSLADEDGPPFVAALEAAFGAGENEHLVGQPLGATPSVASVGRASGSVPSLVADIDAAWDTDEEPPAAPTRADHD